MIVREVLAPVYSCGRAFLIGALHAAGVIAGVLVFGAWLWEVL